MAGATQPTFTLAGNEWPLTDRVKRFFEYQARQHLKFHDGTYRWDGAELVYEYPDGQNQRRTVGEALDNNTHSDPAAMKWAFLIAAGVADRDEKPAHVGDDEMFEQTVEKKIADGQRLHRLETGDASREEVARDLAQEMGIPEEKGLELAQQDTDFL